MSKEATRAKQRGTQRQKRGATGTATRGIGDAALVEGLVQAIATDITTGKVPLNSWLRQESLAAEFGVSRTPVREALRVLQARGMVEVVPNRGALVRGPTARDLREAYVLRAELEGFAAELAAQWIRDSQLRQLREAEKLFQRSVKTFLRSTRNGAELELNEERSGWMQANDLFHRAVHEAAGNARLQAAIEDVHRTFPRNLTWSALSGDSRLMEDNVRAHGEIRAAIEERDPVEARKRMSAHVLRSGELVTMWFERQAPA